MFVEEAEWWKGTVPRLEELGDGYVYEYEIDASGPTIAQPWNNEGFAHNLIRVYYCEF
jgi:hypothetical protein